LNAEAIDSARVWEVWGKEVTPDTRVDWTLLDNLARLSRWLRKEGVDRATAHGLIGKFVYLYYLRHREILSDRKLTRWNIAPAAVFSRGAEAAVFLDLVGKVDEWLNGRIFPLDSDLVRGMPPALFERLAGTFAGDDPETGQLHLDFEAYDFSHIPIEILSVIYEQFLHTPGEGRASKGKPLARTTPPSLWSTSWSRSWRPVDR